MPKPVAPLHAVGVIDTMDVRALSFIGAALLACIALSPFAVVAQSTELPTGRIVGRIVDARSGQGLASVGIQVVGTTLGTMSGVDGR